MGENTDDVNDFILQRIEIEALFEENNNYEKREHAYIEQVESLQQELEALKQKNAEGDMGSKELAATCKELRQELEKAYKTLREIETLGHSSHHAKGYTLANIAKEFIDGN